MKNLLSLLVCSVNCKFLKGVINDPIYLRKLATFATSVFQP